MNQTAHWDDLMRAVVLRTGARIGLNHDWLWPVLCGTLALACAARLSVEMRRSRLSLALLWTGGFAWLAAVVCPALAIGGERTEIANDAHRRIGADGPVDDPLGAYGLRPARAARRSWVAHAAID